MTETETSNFLESNKDATTRTENENNIESPVKKERTTTKSNNLSTTTPNTTTPHQNNSSSNIVEEEIDANILALVPCENATTIVKWLFGEWIGPVVGDYPCSFGNYSGRLYAGWNAICFYSNLFGFERKLSVKYNDIIELNVHRYTSLKINTHLEEFIFRSFSDRLHVYQVIRSLKEKKGNPPTKKKRAVLTTTTSSNLSLLSPTASFTDSIATTTNTSSNGLENSESEESHTNRLSDEVLNKSDTNVNLNDVSKDRIPSFPKSSILEQSTASIDSTVENNNNDNIKKEDTNDKESWKQLKKEHETKYTEIALPDFILNCNLTTFFTLFVSDKACRSIEYFQKNIIKDTDLQTTPWIRSTPSHKDNTFTRTVKFIHSISVPVGASSTRGTKYQTYQHFNNNANLVINTTTVLYDCHNADCFQVEDQWMIEPLDSDKIRISIRFHVNFLKYTMWRQVIDKLTKSNTIDNFSKYRLMLSSTVDSQESYMDEEEETEEENVPHILEHVVHKPTNTFDESHPSNNTTSLTLRSLSSNVLIFLIGVWITTMFGLIIYLVYRMNRLDRMMNIVVENHLELLERIDANRIETCVAAR